MVEELENIEKQGIMAKVYMIKVNLRLVVFVVKKY